jgi:hypothetical protein
MPFNSSLGNHISVINNQIINGLFLSDKARAVDITPGPLLSVPCNNSPSVASDTRCQRTFLVPGGVNYAAAQFANEPAQDDFFLAIDQQSFILNFREGEPSWVFTEVDCLTFGFPFAGFSLCLRNVAENTIQARKSTLSCINPVDLHETSNWRLQALRDVRPKSSADPAASRIRPGTPVEGGRQRWMSPLSTYLWPTADATAPLYLTTAPPPRGQPKRPARRCCSPWSGGWATSATGSRT